MKLAPVFYMPVETDLPKNDLAGSVSADVGSIEGGSGKNACQCRCACQPDMDEVTSEQSRKRIQIEPTEHSDVSGDRFLRADVSPMKEGEVKVAEAEGEVKVAEAEGEGVIDSFVRQSTLRESNHNLELDSLPLGELMALVNENPELMSDLQGVMNQGGNPLKMAREASRLMKKYPELKGQMMALAQNPEIQNMMNDPKQLMALFQR